MPAGIGIVDTMIGFPAEDFKMYDFIRAQLKEGRPSSISRSNTCSSTCPRSSTASDDPIAVTLHEMDRFGVESA